LSVPPKHPAPWDFGFSWAVIGFVAYSVVVLSAEPLFRLLARGEDYYAEGEAPKLENKGKLTTLRIDSLAIIWGYIFCLAGVLNAIFGFHEKCKITDSSALIYGMGIKVGFPFLHNWIQDSYPKASITGTVILSVFTTKLALYALARGFPGTELLIYIGAVMTCFPVFFAVIENDLRKVLAYSLNNQLGFMVCGIGIGSQLAMNGVAGQVVAHVIFKSLLFMSMGAVMHRVGTAKASELGGLFRSMPITAIFCLIGAGSIAAFPLLAGFVTKSMIITSAIDHASYGGGAAMWVVVLMLLFASAGVMEHSGIKVPHFTFFAHDGGHRVKEAPWNMLVAMGLAAALCIFLASPFGGYQFLYSMLPYDVDYHPYTTDHVVFQLQLLMFLKRWTA